MLLCIADEREKTKSKIVLGDIYRSHYFGLSSSNRYWLMPITCKTFYIHLLV